MLIDLFLVFYFENIYSTIFTVQNDKKNNYKK